MDESDSSSNLLSALVQCFGIIIIGYVTGKIWKFSSAELKGLSNFVQYFSLPALLFSSLVKLDFHNVNWAFMASILVSKAIVFAVVALITMAITRPADIGKAGMYAILATQSNDFALGYPLIVALYSSHHQEYANYIYFLAPIQLAILNPIGFLLIELQKQTTEKKTNIIISVLRGTFTNPIIIVTILGLISNEVFHQLPPVLDKLLEVLGSAYSATALFLLGVSLVGKFGKMSGRSILIPILLIIVKIIVLPLVIQKIVAQLTKYNSLPKDINDLSSFGFLYGTFPFAPAAYVYATHYGMPTDVVSTGMVMCTVLAAPIMAISASMVSLPRTGLTLLRSDLLPTKTYSSIVTLVLCLWIAMSFLLRKKWKILTHKATLFILAAQSLLAIEGILTSFNSSNPDCLFAMKLLYIGSLTMLRIWTAILAIILVFLHWRSLCFVLRLNLVLTILGIILPLSAVAFVFAMHQQVTKAMFEYGVIESYTLLFITIVCFIVTGICLVVQQRRINHRANYEPISSTRNSSNMQNNVPVPQTRLHNIESCDIEDICYQTSSGYTSIHCNSNFNCSPEQIKYCNILVQEYQESAVINSSDAELGSNDESDDYHDTHNHVVFLLLLCISMIISLAICTWILVRDNDTGISVELQFVDILLIYGQGLITFFVFEVDFKYISHFCTNIYRRCRYGSNKIVLPDIQNLLPSTLNICQQFRAYHQKRISAECNNSEEMFSGRQFVDSILQYGLVQSRSEGEQYGEHLLLGCIIQHIEQKRHFKDSMLLYQFV